MAELVVEPSTAHGSDWDRALLDPDPALLDRLVAEEPPGVAHFHLMVHVNRTYRTAQRSGRSPEEVAPIAARALAPLERVRGRVGPLERRALDLGLLRWVRRSSALTAVLGAGVTMDAGGPSWAALVRELLERCLTRGRELVEMRLDPTSTETERRYTRHVTGAVHFAEAQAAEARGVRAAIDAGTATVEQLQLGVDLCLGLMGQALFADVTDILYAGRTRGPGEIHRAVAELSAAQLVPDRAEERNPPLFSGWDAIITYNFDDLEGMAIDALGLPRAAWAMRGERLAGDPNPAAQAAGQGAPYQAIYHVHGYTPKRFFNITHVRFVFSTSQYLRFYRGDPSHVVTKALDEYLAHPIKYALYVGCSFTDQAMNNLLRQAAERLPGREHYALLKWPGKQGYAQSTVGEIERHEQPYLGFGVRPVWVDRFEEIPAMLRQLK